MPSMPSCVHCLAFAVAIPILIACNGNTPGGPRPAPVAATATRGVGVAAGLEQRSILVVNANLEETLNAEDVADPADMRNFANRLFLLLGQAGEGAPDLLTLQEVNGVSAQNVAEELGRAFAARYVVGIAPGASSFLGPDTACGTNGRFRRETAIVYNAGTMRAEDPGGYASSCFTNAESSNGRPLIKQQAYMLLRHQRSGRLVAAASLHYATTQNFASQAIQVRKDDEWSAELAALLDSRYPAAVRQVHVIAGDFNTRRCRKTGDETVDCEVRPFWTTLTGTLGFTDAIFSRARHEIGAKRIDYIFTKGRGPAGAELPVGAAASDFGYVSSGCKADPACFYSDHRLYWARLDDFSPGTRER